jgi:copper chaperone NosL
MKQFIFTVFAVVLMFPAWALEDAKPATTDFRSDRCAECHMVVNSRTYAAQIIGSGTPIFFDDIGCLVQYERNGKIQADSIDARFVRSVTTDAWLEVTKAIWVSTKEIRTPMGYGLHAYVDKQAAEAFIQGKKGAKVVIWKDLADLIPARTGMGMGMGKGKK